MGGRVRGRKAGALVAAVIALALLAACVRTTPEARLRSAVSGLQQAIDDRDAAGVRDALADDFIGPEGLGREEAVRFAQGLFLRYRSVGVHAGPLDVRLQGDHATVRCEVMLTGGAALLPGAGQLYRVTTGWRLERDRWTLVAADWTARR